MAATDAAHLHNQPKDVSVTKSEDNMEFSLTEDEMKKINYLGKLERRKHRSRSVKEKQTKFSDQLSLEAQIAMQLAMKDTQDMKRQDGGDGDAGVTSPTKSRHANNHVTFADERLSPLSPRPDTQCSKHSHSSFSETFEKRGSARMSSDLTDGNFDPSLVNKRSLDGMKVESALEVVEIVQHDPERRLVDDDVIEQIAQRNSVEKCLVWMEVLGKEGQLPPGSAGGEGGGGRAGRSARRGERSAKR